LEDPTNDLQPVTPQKSVSISPYYQTILYILLATVLFVIATVLGALIPTELTLAVLQDVADLLEPMGNVSAVSLFLVIFFNNAIKTLGVIIFGIIFAVPPLVFVGFNGFMLGILVSVSISLEGVGLVLAGLLPHGVIEIPVILLATALGFAVGWESFKWLTVRNSQVKAQLTRGLKLYLKWVLPGLLVAALIESFVTPGVIRLVG